MKATALLLLFVIGSPFSGSSQIPDLRPYKTRAAKLEALARVCDSLSAAGKYEDEKMVAAHALRLTDANDPENNSRFHFYLGVVFGEAGEPDSSMVHYERSLYFARKAQKPQRVKSALSKLSHLYLHSTGVGEKSDATVKELLLIADTSRNEF
jgi:hypothetical protein